MKLILALGNPEQKYDSTRHNVGFWVLDEFAKKQSLVWHEKPKFKAYIAESNGYTLVKPTTYYNQVGESARALADFYKIDATDILVVHDDMALPIGTVRTRCGGSDAGNNGIKSINAHMGDATARIRIGTAGEQYSDQTAFVLGKFTTHEQGILNNELAIILAIITDFLHGDFTVTTHRVQA